jgi:hypothetical protein
MTGRGGGGQSSSPTGEAFTCHLDTEPVHVRDLPLAENFRVEDINGSDEGDDSQEWREEQDIRRVKDDHTRDQDQVNQQKQQA